MRASGTYGAGAVRQMERYRAPHGPSLPTQHHGQPYAWAITILVLTTADTGPCV